MNKKSATYYLLLLILAFHSIEGRAQNGQWTTRVTEIPENILSHASSINDGQIFVIGGYLQENNHSAYAKVYNGIHTYNITMNTWRRLPSNLQNPRGQLVSATIGDYIFVMGGFGDVNFPYAYYGVDKLNVKTGVLIDIDSLIIQKYGFALSVVDEKLLLIGGAEVLGTSTSLVEHYDPITWTRKQLPSLPIPLTSSGSILMDKSIYMFGGATDHWVRPGSKIFKYDIIDNSWSQIPTRIPVNLSRMAVSSHSGFVYIFGGQQTPIKTKEAPLISSAVYIFDPETEFLQEIDSMPKGLTGMTAHEFGGKIYLVGGATADALSKGTASDHTPAINVYTPVKAPIYSLKTSLSKYSLQSRDDSCLILSQIINHQKHKAIIRAELTGQSKGDIIDLELFDDGEHGDGESGDGYYGNSFKHPGIEDFFQIRIIVDNLNLLEKFISGKDCRPFTTIGPVLVASTQVINKEIAASGNIRVTFSLDLKNYGLSTKTGELTVDLFSNINEVEIVKKTSICPSIDPGMTSTCLTDFEVLISSKYHNTSLPPIQVSVSSQDHSFWNDVIEVSISEK